MTKSERSHSILNNQRSCLPALSISNFVIRISDFKMASVAGLAPARTGLKGRLLDLLCIHGRVQEKLQHQPPSFKEIQYPLSKLLAKLGLGLGFWSFSEV